MSKTSLAYINDQAVAISATRRTTQKVNIAGFDVELPRNDNSSERTIQAFQVQAGELRKSLTKIGISPLAVLPLDWWDEIVERTGLLKVDANQRGMVEYDASSLAREASKFRYKATTFVLLYGSLLIACALGLTLLDAPPPAYLSLFVPGIAGFAGFGMSIDTGSFSSFNVAWMMAVKGKREVLRELLTGRKYGSYVRVTLPTPPDHVKEVLVKAKEHNLDMQVVAEADAITLARTPSDLIIAEAKKIALEDRERRAEARRLADPIVYVRNGNAIAIIAQFGDFPIEKKVVDAVVQNGL